MDSQSFPFSAVLLDGDTPASTPKPISYVWLPPWSGPWRSHLKQDEASSPQQLQQMEKQQRHSCLVATLQGNCDKAPPEHPSSCPLCATRAICYSECLIHTPVTVWILSLLLGALPSQMRRLHTQYSAYLKGADCPVRQCHLHKQKWLQNTAQGAIGRCEEIYKSEAVGSCVKCATRECLCV